MRKAWIIAIFFLSLQSCGSYEIVTLNHRPTKQVKVIVDHSYSNFGGYTLIEPTWRYRIYNPYTVPRVEIIRPSKRVVILKGGRTISRSSDKSTNRTKSRR